MPRGIASLLGLATALGVGSPLACSGDAFHTASTGGAAGASAGTAGQDAGVGGNAGTGASGGNAGTGASGGDASAGASGGNAGTGGTASGGTGGSSCGSGQKLCNGVCVDTANNPSHCGDCNQVCPSGMGCQAGNCVKVACSAGATESCYSGPSGSQNVGICKPGSRTCNAAGTGFGPCIGEVVPQSSDNCGTPQDENCDGKINDSCATTSCKDIKAANAGAASGVFSIDPDGTGAGAAFDVYCEMTIEGGGWTRFNWVKSAYTSGQDPLGQQLDQCPPSATVCRGRIPATEVPTQLLVLDVTSGQRAIWKFDGSVTSNAVLGALRDKKEYCGQNKGAWQPISDTSTESFCGKGTEGGCDSFMYSNANCMGVTNWVLELDGDGYWCEAAFKLGATAGGGCGTADHGYLNDCDCNDEYGELYYR